MSKVTTAADVAFYVVATFVVTVTSSSDDIYTRDQFGCDNSSCSSTVEPDCEDCGSSHAVAISFISVVICLLPLITWGTVIWYACKTDPVKQIRRRRRRQLSEQTQNEAEDPENVQMSDPPPSYEEYANYSLYRPDSTVWAISGGVSMTNVTPQNTGGVNSAILGSGDEDCETPPPSYEAAANGSVIPSILHVV